jgi:Tfp pilus tip-associated adhesin PilY1
LKHSPLHRSIATSVAALLLIAPGRGSSDDVDLFKRSVPPNILFFVDNSSSMMNQVYHPDWSGTHTDGGEEKANSSQKDCRFFRRLSAGEGIPSNKRFKVFVEKKNVTYYNRPHDHDSSFYSSDYLDYLPKTGNPKFHQQEAYYRGSPKSWEREFPIRDRQGNRMFLDLDQDGSKDFWEPYIYHRMLDPDDNETSDSDWKRKNGLQGSGSNGNAPPTDHAVPIEDYDGTHLFYDEDDDGTFDPSDDRWLYYELTGSNSPRTGNPKGTSAEIKTYITPASAAMNAGINPLTLEFDLDYNNREFDPTGTLTSSDFEICGVSPVGVSGNYSLFGNDDPNAATFNGQLLQLSWKYLDFVFSSHGTTARADIFDIERDYPSLVDNSGVNLAGKRAKAGCLSLLPGEDSYYYTYRRSRTQALQLILRQIICRVNEATDTGVRFGFSQFRYHHKKGDDNGAYVAIPVEDWYSDSAKTTQTSYTIHGITATHEDHLQRVITHTTPDAQTPLSEGLFQLYTYFMSREAANMPYGRDWKGQKRDGAELSPALKFPVYNYDMSLYEETNDKDLIGGRFMGVDPLSTTEDATVPAPASTNFDCPNCAAPDPILYACQKNFILIITDGGSAGDDFSDRDEDIRDTFDPPDPAYHTHTDRGYSDFPELIGDHFRIDDDSSAGQNDETGAQSARDDVYPGGTGPAGDKNYAKKNNNLLDDITLFMNRYDMRPDLDGEQTIDTYTVGYSVESVEAEAVEEDPLNDDDDGDGVDDGDDNCPLHSNPMEDTSVPPDGILDEQIDTDLDGIGDACETEFAQDAILIGSALRRAAIRGNGRYFESADADQLENDLVVAISEMVDKAQAFTSATVPASRTTDGNHFYSSYFLPKDNSGFWEGHLKNFEFTALGDILDINGFCATGGSGNIAPDPTCASGGAFDLFAEGYWDAADVVPLPEDRALFISTSTDLPFLQPSKLSKSIATTEFNIQVAVDGDENGVFDGILDNGDEFDNPYLAEGYTTTGEIRDALVDVLRGCEFGSLSPNCTYRKNDEETHKIYLGDIFHSNPVVVGSPNSAVNETHYREFALAKRSRPRVIYAGANDGMLHGFHAGEWPELDSDGDPISPPRHGPGTGEELMGYIPNAVREIIKNLPKEMGTSRTLETVDASPVVADVWLHRELDGVSQRPTGALVPDALLEDKLAEQWRTILLAGLRDGGRSYFALDITDPPETSALSNSGSGYPLHLWDFPCTQPTAACTGSANLPAGKTYADYMGFTWSEAVMTRIRVLIPGGPATGNERWVAIFGAGYDTRSDPNDEGSADPADDYSVSEIRGRALFMVDIATGEVMAVKYFDPANHTLPNAGGGQVGYEEMKYAFASAPAVFDLDFDGFADVVYIGDLGGQLWKWVIKSPGGDPINDAANASVAQPNWPFRVFYYAQPSAVALERNSPPGAYDSSIHYQNFFFPPTGAMHSGKVHLAFGAGERSNPLRWDNDGLTSNNNRFFMVKESDPLEKFSFDINGAPEARDIRDDAWSEGDLENLDAPTLNCADMQSQKQGYYFSTRDAEKFVTNSVVFLGEVTTGSFMPPDPNDPTAICESSGNSSIYRFELSCGVGAFGEPADPPETRRRTDVGGGIPTRPRISVGDLNQGGGSVGDCKNKIVMITSDGAISNDCPGQLEGAGIKVRSWRQR